MGADTNGFYLTTNEYTLSTFAFNGGVIYALSKTGLETGTNTTVTRIFAGPMTLSLPNGGLAFTIQPAASPTPSDFQAANGGTEFFMSATDWGAAPASGRGPTGHDDTPNNVHFPRNPFLMNGRTGFRP